MKTHHLLLVVAFAGTVIRHLLAPGVVFVEWDEWLVIATALATVGYLIHEWRHGRQLDGEIADIFHRVGHLEGSRDSYERIDTRVADLYDRVSAVEQKIDIGDQLSTLRSRLDMMGTTIDNMPWADEEEPKEEDL